MAIKIGTFHKLYFGSPHVGWNDLSEVTQLDLMAENPDWLEMTRSVGFIVNFTMEWQDHRLSLSPRLRIASDSLTLAAQVQAHFARCTTQEVD